MTPITNNDKIGKSRGNAIYADDLADAYGVDAVRYYVLHEIPFANDGNLTYELLEERYNSDLANILGNLVNRTISMSKKYFDGVVENSDVTEEIDTDLINTVLNSVTTCEKCMDELRVADAIDEVFNIFRRCNKYIDETTPWILAKEENKDRLKKVMYNLLESIRIGAVLLHSFLPETADKIFEQLNTDIRSYESIKEFGVLKEGTILNDPSPLFMRIEKKDN